MHLLHIIYTSMQDNTQHHFLRFGWPKRTGSPSRPDRCCGALCSLRLHGAQSLEAGQLFAFGDWNMEQVVKCQMTGKTQTWDIDIRDWHIFMLLDAVHRSWSEDEDKEPGNFGDPAKWSQTGLGGGQSWGMRILKLLEAVTTVVAPLAPFTSFYMTYDIPWYSYMRSFMISKHMKANWALGEAFLFLTWMSF